MGIDVKRFEGNVQQDLICSICSDVFEDPIQTPTCEHFFCRNCITRWMKRNPVCPIDMQTLKQKDLKDAPRLLRSFLGDLKICCDFASLGCNMFVRLEQLVVHVKDCDFNPEFNLFCSKGCGVRFERQSFVSSHDCIKHLLDVVKGLETVRCRLEEQVKRKDDVIQLMKEKDETVVQLMREKREGEDLINQMIIKSEKLQEKMKGLQKRWENLRDENNVNISDKKQAKDEIQALRQEIEELKKIVAQKEAKRKGNKPKVCEKGRIGGSGDAGTSLSLVTSRGEQTVPLIGESSGSLALISSLPTMAAKFSPGDIIISDIEPFTHCLKTRFKGDACDWCFKRVRFGECLALKRCTKCRVMSYCSEECQQKDWASGHNCECKYFSKSQQLETLLKAENSRLSPEWGRILMRTVLKLRKNPDFGTKAVRLEVRREMAFSGLPLGAAGTGQMGAYVRTWMTSFELIYGEPLLPLEVLVQIGLKLDQHCLQIDNPNAMLPMGSGLYLITAFFSHDSSPNAEIKFKDNLLEVRFEANYGGRTFDSRQEQKNKIWTHKSFNSKQLLLSMNAH